MILQLELLYKIKKLFSNEQKVREKMALNGRRSLSLTEWH